MKIKLSSGAIGHSATVLLALSLLVVNARCARAQDRPGPADQNEQLRQMEDKARDLKAQGRTEEARDVLAKVQELRADLAPDRQEGGPDLPPPGNSPDREHLKGQRQKLMAQLENLRAGEVDLKQRLLRLERELQDGGPHPPGMDRGWQAATPGERHEQPPGGGPEMEARREHLKVAIKNLHAAGFDALADRLSQQIEMGPPFAFDGPGPERLGQPPGRGPGRMGLRGGPEGRRAQLDDLRGEVRDLRQAVRDLRVRVDELSRDRR